MKILLTLGILLLACHTGDLAEHCNPDGTCNAADLRCGRPGWDDNVCHVKPAEVHVEPASVGRKCSWESDCFCVTCAEKCGDAGVKLCSYSDTSVWGSKPATCECK